MNSGDHTGRPSFLQEYEKQCCGEQRGRNINRNTSFEM